MEANNWSNPPVVAVQGKMVVDPPLPVRVSAVYLGNWYKGAITCVKYADEGMEEVEGRPQRKLFAFVEWEKPVQPHDTGGATLTLLRHSWFDLEEYGDLIDYFAEMEGPATKPLRYNTNVSPAPEPLMMSPAGSNNNSFTYGGSNIPSSKPYGGGSFSQVYGSGTPHLEAAGGRPSGHRRSGRTGVQFTKPQVHAAPTYKQVIERKQDATVFDYLNARLARDRRTPPTILKIVYCGFEFTPWFYAPFPLVNSNFCDGDEVLHNGYLCPYTCALYPSEDLQIEASRNYLMSSDANFDDKVTAAEQGKSDKQENEGSPPGGQLVYDDPDQGVSVYKVAGKDSHVVPSQYCRNLYCLGKTFLNEKLVGHDVGLYNFFVLCLYEWRLLDFLHDETGEEQSEEAKQKTQQYRDSNATRYFAAFWTLETSIQDEELVSANNLACIMTLPCFQSRGVGTFMINHSYAVAIKTHGLKYPGTPETPLSELGEVAYRRYWEDIIWKFCYHKMTERKGPLSRPVSPNSVKPRGSGKGSNNPETKAAPKAKGQVVSTSATVENRTSGGKDSSSHQRKQTESRSMQDISLKCRIEVEDLLETMKGLGLVGREQDLNDHNLQVIEPFLTEHISKQQKLKEDPTLGGRIISFDKRCMVGGGPSSAVKEE